MPSELYMIDGGADEHAPTMAVENLAHAFHYHQHQLN